MRKVKKVLAGILASLSFTGGTRALGKDKIQNDVENTFSSSAKLSKTEQEQIDAYMSGFGQSFGYDSCNTSIAIEGYNGGNSEFVVEAGNETAINALGIGRNDLPTKGNAPNNNNILAQIFAKSVKI